MKKRVTLTLDSSLLHQVDDRIDGHTIKNRSHAVELLIYKALGSGNLRKAVILAGGYLCDSGNNVLLKIHGKTLLEHLLMLLKKYQVDEVILAVSKDKNIKINELRSFGLKINCVEEKKPMGTAGSLLLAKKYLNETFIVSNGDELKDIDISEMLDMHKSNKALVTIALTTVDDPHNYGVARLSGLKILEFVEKPQNPPSNLINAGFYIVEPEVLDLIPRGYATFERDIFPKIAKMGRLIGYPFSGQWYDTGDLELYKLAKKKWKDIT